MSEAGELAHKFRGAWWSGLAARTEIPSAKQVAGRDYRSPHRPVFIGALGPGQFAVDPQIETHDPILSAAE